MQFTRFFGREAELKRLLEISALESATGRLRQITITGSAGIGKTRLAVETATHLREAYRERVWFIPLYDLEEAQRIALFVANALDPDSTDSSPMERITALLGGEPSLLVLDNVEHLLELSEDADEMLFASSLLSSVVTQFLDNLLDSLPNLVILATSRRPFGYGG